MRIVQWADCSSGGEYGHISPTLRTTDRQMGIVVPSQKTPPRGIAASCGVTTFGLARMSGTFLPRRSLRISLPVARKMLHIPPFAQKVDGEYVILGDTF